MTKKQLDAIEVMLLKIDENDSYKAPLEKEYELYRTSLESIPRDVNVPQTLSTSVFSMEQRLRNYVILGKSSNPLLELAPTISPKITSEEDKKELVNLANSNASYIANRKSSLAILKSYLDKIDFQGNLEDICSTIKLVQEKYEKTNIFSNEFEQEITRAKYFYELRLLYDGELSRASEYATHFDSGMILFLHKHHQDTVHRLLEEGRSRLAEELNTFLTEMPQDKEKDIAFWKVLAQIENPEYNPNSDIIIDESNSIVVDEIEETTKEITTVKKRRFLSLRNLFQRKSLSVPGESMIVSASKTKNSKYYSASLNSESVVIHLTLNFEFYMLQDELDKLENLLSTWYKKESEPFSNVSVYVTEVYSTPMFEKYEYADLGRIVRRLTNYAHITLLDVKVSQKSHIYEITEGMFQGTYFDTFVVHGGLWKIGPFAFYKTHFLQKVDFSDAKIYHIKDYAFSEAQNLTEVILPEISTAIMDSHDLGAYVFENCYSLTKFEFPYKLTEINEGFFKGCRKLTSVGYLGQITRIGDRAFEGCENFSDFPFSSDIEEVGHRAFFGCKSLTDFSFKNIRRIGDYAFAETGLKSVTLTLELHQVGVGIFSKSNLHSVWIEDSLVLTSEIFKGCQNLERVHLDDGIAVFGDACFEDCKNLESVNIPSLLGQLGEKCFKNCKSLSVLEFPVGCRRIGAECFSGCDGLTKFQLPKVDVIEPKLFYECTHLETVTFADEKELLEISEKAFCLCGRLRDFKIPSNVKAIGNGAFAGTDLEKVILPDSLTDLGEGVFNECRRLEEVTLSKYLREIKAETFRNCYNLCEIDLSPCYISTIGKYAFARCDSLKKIVLSVGIRKVYKSSFEKVYSIDTIVVPVKLIGLSKEEQERIHEDYTPLYSFLENSLGLSEDFSIVSVSMEAEETVAIQLNFHYGSAKVTLAK